MPDSIEGEVRGRYLSASHTIFCTSTLRYSYLLSYRSLFFVVRWLLDLSILDRASGHAKIYLEIRHLRHPRVCVYHDVFGIPIEQNHRAFESNALIC